MEENARLLDEFVVEDVGTTIKQENRTIPKDFEIVEDDAPTQQELRTLRRVPDNLPSAAYLVAVIELCERFAYYGLSGPFQNYMQNNYPDTSGIPGALGLGQKSATALSSFFQFWCYVTPILGAIVADQYWGRFRTILWFSVVYIVGLLILVITSTPLAIRSGAAFGGLIISMLVIGLGAGGIKSNVSPLIGEQYRQTRLKVVTLPSSEKIIIDPSITIQRIYMMFYVCINIGSLATIPTTLLERHIGFWCAYLLPLFIFLMGFIVLIGGRNRYVVIPPQGSVILNTVKILLLAARSDGSLNAAKSTHNPNLSILRKSWDDNFVDEVKTALQACKIFLFFPFYWMAFNQMLNNFVSQAGSMALHGIPNDIMQSVDSAALITLIPLMDSIIYPALRSIGVQSKPITRIFWGFIFAALAMTYAAFVQHLIYQRPPHSVHVAMQIPAYILIAISEICASITGLEYAFMKAPPSMRSFVTSIFLLNVALGAILAGLLSPLAVDPKLVWMYAGLSIACFIAAMLFWTLFKHHNQDANISTQPDDSDLHCTGIEGANPSSIMHRSVFSRQGSASSEGNV